MKAGADRASDQPQFLREHSETTSHSRGGVRPSSASGSPSNEGAGKTGWPLHPGPPRKRNLRERVNHRYRRCQPAFPAQWFTAYSVLSPVNQRFATVTRATRKARRRELGACIGAPEPHDFVVRKCTARLSAQFASTAFRSTFVTTRTPLHRNGTHRPYD